jgi:cell division protein FtsB
LNDEINDLEYKYKKLEEENEKLKEDIERLA